MTETGTDLGSLQGSSGDTDQAARRVVVAPDVAAVGEAAATLILDALAESPGLVLGVATGSTPLPVYAALARARESGAEFSRARWVGLDEYVGLPDGHPASCRTYVQSEIIGPLGLAPDAVALPEGQGEDLEQWIRSLGGVDVQILGIGRNGHLAFNEPGSPLDSRTRVVELSPVTRADNARFFTTLDDVPRQAVTQGLGTIMAARRVLLLATGPAKATAIARALEGPVTPDCPASVLQTHGDVMVVLDEAAAAGLGSVRPR